MLTPSERQLVTQSCHTNERRDVIGEMVMVRLRELDDVAYARFASVCGNFREAKDLELALRELPGDEAVSMVPGRK
jgi:transcriptional regulator NrdR family protein